MPPRKGNRKNHESFALQTPEPGIRIKICGPSRKGFLEYNLDKVRVGDLFRQIARAILSNIRSKKRKHGTMK